MTQKTKMEITIEIDPIFALELKHTKLKDDIETDYNIKLDVSEHKVVVTGDNTNDLEESRVYLKRENRVSKFLEATVLTNNLISTIHHNEEKLAHLEKEFRCRMFFVKKDERNSTLYAKGYYDDVLEEFQSEVLELIESRAYMTPTVEDFTELNRYLEVGKDLKESIDMIYFNHLINSIKRNESPFLLENCKNLSITGITFSGPNKPFIFICASSGTGKTQLPFSLDRPLLYFIYNTSLVSKNRTRSIQRIYKPFLSTSHMLMKFVEKDLNMNRNYFETDYLILNPKIPFFTLGFLIKLLKQILKSRLCQKCSEENIEKPQQPFFDKYEKFNANEKHLIFGKCNDLLKCEVCKRSVLCANQCVKQAKDRIVCQKCHELKSLHWSISQTGVDIDELLDVRACSITEALEELSELFKNEEYGIKSLPIIFFDECQRTANDPDFILRYRFVRRIFRSAGFTSIFMGTDASLANFVGLSQLGSSRTDEEEPWCYIWHRLPPVSKKYLESSKKLCLSFLEESISLLNFPQVK